MLAQELASCRLLYADKSLCWTLQADNDLWIDSAPRIVAIVFGNLLRNAGSYTRAGTVLVHVAGTTVTIRDSGMGMSASQLDEVFDPLRSRQHAQGNGIGLSLVKRITERFAWVIDIDSGPERGTAVRVDLSQGRVTPAGGVGQARPAAVVAGPVI